MCVISARLLSDKKAPNPNKYMVKKNNLESQTLKMISPLKV